MIVVIFQNSCYGKVKLRKQYLSIAENDAIYQLFCETQYKILNATL